MKERPILFSGPLVRAILEGTKTQTRRIVKLPLIDRNGSGCEIAGCEINGMLREGRFDLCPYGQPGDRLWVRESWQYADWTETGYPWIGYRADGAKSCIDEIPEEWSERLTDIWAKFWAAPSAKLSDPANYVIDQRAAERKWRPSIHMPRWASRITLEITSIRVERLQDISEADAKAEGVEASTFVEMKDGSPCYSTPYQILWEQINGVGSWEQNPYVWVIQFRNANRPNE